MESAFSGFLSLVGVDDNKAAVGAEVTDEGGVLNFVEHHPQEGALICSVLLGGLEFEG